MYLGTCMPSKDSDQPAHLCSLIRIFTGLILDGQECKVSIYVDNKDWSDCTMCWLIWIFVGLTWRKVHCSSNNPRLFFFFLFYLETEGENTLRIHPAKKWRKISRTKEKVRLSTWQTGIYKKNYIRIWPESFFYWIIALAHWMTLGLENNWITDEESTNEIFIYCFHSACARVYTSLCFMPPTSKKLEGHMIFGLLVCLPVCLVTKISWKLFELGPWNGELTR